MRLVISTSFLIISLFGTAQAKSSNGAVLPTGHTNEPMAVADSPIPDPHSKQCPQLVADSPIPDPHSKQCPSVAV